MTAAKTKKRKRVRHDAHVRLYGWEMETSAYRTMSTDARALLIEFRSLYSGQTNRVFLSVRDMMQRLGIGQRRTQRARDELLGHGWIRLLEQGAFTRKVRHAAVYALTNEPLTDADGDTAPKDYMRWQSTEPRFLSVAATATDGSRHGYRDPETLVKKCPTRSRHRYRQTEKRQTTVAATATQIGYQAQRSVARAGGVS